MPLVAVVRFDLEVFAAGVVQRSVLHQNDVMNVIDQRVNAMIAKFERSGFVQGFRALDQAVQLEVYSKEGGILNRRRHDIRSILRRRALRRGVVAEQVDAEGAGGRIIGDDSFNVGGSGNFDNRLGIQKAHGVSQEMSRLDDIMFGGGREIRRSGEGEHISLADSVEKDRRADWSVGAHRPIGAFFALALTCRAGRLQ